MSHHFIDQLEDLKSRLARMTALVQQAVEQAVEAVFDCDAELAQQVIDGDARIDEEEVKVEKGAIDLLALYQPAATDLRLITTVIKANSDFERIADCAVNIAQRLLPISNGPASGTFKLPTDLRVMANSVVATLRDTIKAFNLGDEPLARKLLKGDDVVDALYHQIVQDMLALMQSDSHQANLDLSTIMIAKNLERIADHCTNIAESVVYVQSGRIIRHLHTV
jgi:phosphate transport system protein